VALAAAMVAITMTACNDGDGKCESLGRADTATIERHLIATAWVENHGPAPMPAAPAPPPRPAPVAPRPAPARPYVPAPRPVQQGPTVINNYNSGGNIWPWVWLASQDHC
jgi:hypothetical protein